MMETILLEIIEALKDAESLDDKALSKIFRQHNKHLAEGVRPHAKKRILPFYLKVKDADPVRWARWGIDEATEKRLFRTLQVKPRRTASGVATITVITKPWPCSSNCLYCPNDVRMPKSYLSNEPACQRAERNYFDPYLQVVSRLRALTHMGHPTDKIELIVLGGTWSDYPQAYQIWFVTELFRALNDNDQAEAHAAQRRTVYQERGFDNTDEALKAFSGDAQRKIEAGLITYNQAVDELYLAGEPWKNLAAFQQETIANLQTQQFLNEQTRHRVVGLVIETRPDTITAASLRLIRKLGCTKVQIGIQSLNPAILKQNNRRIDIQRIQQSFELLRVFGFKVHAHFMANLYGATPEGDVEDYRQFVTAPAYLPDEVKLYPCALVGGTGLCACYDKGEWRPYTEEELLAVLSVDLLNTPSYVRVSRMIRDISAQDILVGNKKTNLRQLVEGAVEHSGGEITEIRYREINKEETVVEDLRLEVISYETTNTSERFLQWVTPEGKIAGFLRLSLPNQEYVQHNLITLPIVLCAAMIREVHVYGRVAQLHHAGHGAQHLGLGRRLVEAACVHAKAAGCQTINVISSVGTREYYRGLGFRDGELYQWKSL